MNDMYIEFSEDDKPYQDWLKHHPEGYVINTERSKPANYMVLHRAKCRTISQYNKVTHPGGFTERQYIKICSMERAKLQAWVKQHGRRDGSFSKECSKCNP